MLLIFLLLSSIKGSFPPSKKHSTRIICIGDSITFGYGSSNSHEYSYPAVLQKLLNHAKYEVFNLGLSRRTMRKDGKETYWKAKQYTDALYSKADIILLMLGTNDAKTINWNERKFFEDYCDMVNELKRLTRAKIYIMRPPPLYKEVFGMNQSLINHVLPNVISRIGLEKNVNGVIDVFQALGGSDLKTPDFFKDFCHPNDMGYKMIAETIYEDVFQKAEFESSSSESLNLISIAIAAFILYKMVSQNCIYMMYKDRVLD